MDADPIDKLDRYRKRRSMTIYDVAGVITTAEASDMQFVAQHIIASLDDWLAQNHPSLVKKKK